MPGEWKPPTKTGRRITPTEATQGFLRAIEPYVKGVKPQGITYMRILEGVDSFESKTANPFDSYCFDIVSKGISAVSGKSDRALNYFTRLIVHYTTYGTLNGFRYGLMCVIGPKTSMPVTDSNWDASVELFFATKSALGVLTTSISQQCDIGPGYIKPNHE